MRGYALRQGKGKTGALESTWTLSLRNESLLTHASQDAEMQAQRATNLDGAILYKFLEADLVAIATQTRSPERELVVYIIKASTGKIIHRFFEKQVDIDAGVQLALSENRLFVLYKRSSPLNTKR